MKPTERIMGGVKPFATFDHNIADTAVIDGYLVAKLVDGSLWVVFEDGTKERIEP